MTHAQRTPLRNPSLTSLFTGAKERQSLERLFLRSGEWGLHTALTGIHPLLTPLNLTPIRVTAPMVRTITTSGSRSRDAGAGGGRSTKGLASIARAPLFEVRGVRFTHRPYWHTSVTHTLGAVGSQRCGARGAVGGSVSCSRVSPQSCTIPAGAKIRTHNLGLQVQRSIH